MHPSCQPGEGGRDHGVLVSLGCWNESFLTALEAGKSKVKVLANTTPGENPPPVLQAVTSSLCPHTAEQRTWKLVLFSSGSLLFILFYFINMYLFLIGRDRTQVGEGQREKETQNQKQAPGSKLSAQIPVRGSNPQTVRS